MWEGCWDDDDYFSLQNLIIIIIIIIIIILAHKQVGIAASVGHRSLALETILKVHLESDGPLVWALPKNDIYSGEKVEKQKNIKKSEKVEKQKNIKKSEKVEKQKNIKKSKKVEKQKNIKKRVTKVGDVIDLRKLFNENKVKADDLAGKLIVLLFAPRCVTSNSFKHDTKLLMNGYYKLQPNDFEVVFVPPTKLTLSPGVNISAQEFFDREFSWMPWTAISYSDKTSRLHVQKNLGVSGSKPELSTVYLIRPTGLVFERDLRFLKYLGEGMDGAEYDAIIKQPSLENLLTSHKRDYVITNKGEQVPIHTLKGKVVALYFYEKVHTRVELTNELKKAYGELSKEGFEVVLVYTSEGFDSGHRSSEKEFWECFQTMPWLALPFRDPNEQKLVEIFEFFSSSDEDLDVEEHPPELVIFGPQGEFVEPLGAEILSRFGTTAYPFTRKKVAKLYTEKVNKLKLEMLWNANTIFSGKDGLQRVILFVERLKRKGKGPMESIKIKFLKSLKERYLQMKGTDDEFEVIHMLKIHPRYLSGLISTAESQAKSSAVKYIGDMPWLVSVASELLPADFDSYFCHDKEDNIKYNSSVVLAFDRDGRVVRSTMYPTVEDLNFPFYPRVLEDEALAQLNTFHGWNYWDYYPNNGRIYSIRDKLLKVSC